MRMKKLAGLAGYFLLASACSSSSSDDADIKKFRELDYVIVNAGDMTTTTEEISGSGSLAFNAPISGGIESGSHFFLEAKLEDGGAVSLVTYAESDLKNGYELKVTRSGAALMAKLVKGSTENDISEALAGIDGSETFKLHLDVHNDEGHALIWVGDEPAFSEETAVFNSEDAAGKSPGKGDGPYWGLRLEKATVFNARLSEVKFEHGDEH